MNKVLSILYLEDDRNDVELVGIILSHSGLLFELEHVEDRVSYVHALEKGCYDVILIDFKLLSFDGLSALKMAKDKCTDTPVIILSGSLSEAQALDIINEGAADYVLKDRLTREEFEIVRKHPAHGENILRPIKQLYSILPIIRHHHERIDGKGYPDGLKGKEIPIGARILHVADSFDSMTADRPYRPAPGMEYAISEFRKYSGIQFCPEAVNAFLSILGDV